MYDIDKDEFYLEGAYMFKGEMPHEEVSRVFLKRKIKKSERDEVAKQLKSSYSVNRVNFISIERD
jgi:hypothetical protein